MIWCDRLPFIAINAWLKVTGPLRGRGGGGQQEEQLACKKKAGFGLFTSATSCSQHAASVARCQQGESLQQPSSGALAIEGGALLRK